AQAAPEAERAAVARYQMAEIYLRELSRPGDAARALAEVVKRDPESASAWRSLGRAAMAGEDFATVAKALASELILLPEGGSRAEGGVRLGEIYEDRLGDDASAGKAYAAALEQDSSLRDAHFGLIRVRARARDEADLASAYAGLAEACAAEDPEAS